MQNKISWEELSVEANRDTRREKRVLLVFPIEVCGFNLLGEFFAERTSTDDISESGCQFRLHAELQSGSIVAIRLTTRKGIPFPAHKPRLFQVAWVSREGDSWATGARKLQPGNIWPMAFPPSKAQASPVSEGVH